MDEGARGGRRTTWLGALLVLALAAIPALAIGLRSETLLGLRGEVADALIDLRSGDRPPPKDVVVIAVDPQTLLRYGNPPLRRGLYADAIRRLDAAGAAAVGIDVQFTEPGDDPSQDEALLVSIEDTDIPVVLVTTQVRAPQRPGGPVDTGVLGGRVNLAPAGAEAAHGGIPTDAGVWRRADRTVDGLASFGDAVARAAGGPGVPRGGMLIDPTVDADRVRTYSFGDLLGGRVPRSALRGKAVVVGFTAVGVTGDDRGRIAGTQKPVFGVFVQAQIVATALAGAPLTAGAAWSWAFALLAALVSLVSAFRRRLLAQIGWIVADGLLVFAVVLIAARSGALIDPVLPWLVLLAGGLGGITYRIAVERRARAAARSTLGRFVPPSVVDELLRDGSDGRIPPHAETATVMFVDLRGYTALTAGLARPEALVEVLDAYLGAVSRVVYEHRGAVVSFQGDGVMAAFGVPVDDGRAAEHAVDAARALLGEALPAVRTQLAATLGDGPAGALALGIGIATGPVFAGTVGPAARREYAVVGPTTNLAARLQARTKEEAGPVLIDDATAAAILGDDRTAAHTGVRTPDGPLVPLGPREIRGLDRAIDCWTLRA